MASTASDELFMTDYFAFSTYILFYNMVVRTATLSTEIG